MKHIQLFEQFVNEKYEILTEAKKVDYSIVQDNIGREMYKLNKQFTPMLNKMIELNTRLQNSLKGEGGSENEDYIKLTGEFIEQLKDIKYKTEKGIW
jgi:hypothetical protein